MTTKTTTKQYTDSTIIIITGPKRNGKSLLLAYTILMDLLSGKRVWSNMKVHTPPAMVRQGFPKRETEPIDWQLLYALDKELIEGSVGIDEITYIASSRESLSVKNRLFNSIIRQAGHRNLNFYGTARKLAWCDNHVQAEADLEIKVSDLRFTPWGKQNSVAGGKTIKCEFFDLSGAITGRSCFDHGNRPYKVSKFHGEKYWKAYDTKEIVPLEDCFMSVKLDMKQMTVGNRQRENDNVRDILDDIIGQLVEQEKTEVPTDVFWQMAESMGISGDSRSLGRYLPRGVQRRERRGGNIYDLSGYMMFNHMDTQEST